MAGIHRAAPGFVFGIASLIFLTACSTTPDLSGFDRQTKAVSELATGEFAEIDRVMALALARAQVACRRTTDPQERQFCESLPERFASSSPRNPAGEAAQDDEDGDGAEDRRISEALTNAQTLLGNEMFRLQPVVDAAFAGATAYSADLVALSEAGRNGPDGAAALEESFRDLSETIGLALPGAGDAADHVIGLAFVALGEMAISSANRDLADAVEQAQPGIDLLALGIIRLVGACDIRLSERFAQSVSTELQQTEGCFRQCPDGTGTSYTALIDSLAELQLNALFDAGRAARLEDRLSGQGPWTRLDLLDVCHGAVTGTASDPDRSSCRQTRAPEGDLEDIYQDFQTREAIRAAAAAAAAPYRQALSWEPARVRNGQQLARQINRWAEAHARLPEKIRAARRPSLTRLVSELTDDDSASPSGSQ